MLKIFFSFIFILLSFTNSFSQLRPDSYSLQGNENYLSKISSSNEINSQNPASNSISDIITIGDTVWLGTSRGVSVSFDRGETWTNFYGNEAFGTMGISAIGYDKHTGTFWAAKVYFTPLGDEEVQTGGGLVYTSDNGTNWTTIPHPLDNRGDTVIAYGINDGINLPLVYALDIIVPQQNVIYDIAFSPGTIWITSWAGGLRKAYIDSIKLNPNYKWERVLLPSDALDQISPEDTIKFELEPRVYNNHLGFSVETIGDSILYVGTAGGINKSTDGGISWRKFNHTNQENSIGGNWVIGLDFNQTTQTLWAVNWRAEGETEFNGVASTSDGGENWQTFLKEEKVYNFGFKLDDVIAPSDNGPFRTRDQGNTWILPNNIIDESSGVSLTATGFFSAASEGDDIWLGSDDGLVRLSEDTGSFWNGEWKIYFASQPLSSAVETYAYPNPFSPRQEILKIKYSTGGENKKVTIRIFDFSMNIVRTVIQNADRSGLIHAVDNFNLETNGVIDRWDGTDENGKIVPNGVYFYRIDFDNDDPVFGKIIVLQ